MLARHSRGLPPLYPSPAQAHERSRAGLEVFRKPGGGNLIGSGNHSAFPEICPWCSGNSVSAEPVWRALKSNVTKSTLLERSCIHSSAAR